MSESNVSRRQFNQLSAAALGGLMLGSSSVFAAEKSEGESLLLQEPHVCRGLNTCKGMDASKKNACAGMGVCATATAHDCKGMNACKGQGAAGRIRAKTSVKATAAVLCR